METKVSIIIPVYQVEEYLARCLESVLRQSYQNIEVILVDDGSKDKSGEICDTYAAKDSRVKVIHKENGGLSDARNVGFQNSSGQIISFVDSDDWIHHNMIRNMLSIMESTCSDIVVCQSVKTDGFQDQSKLSGEIKEMAQIDALTMLCRNQKIASHAWDKLYKRSVLEDIPFPKGKYYEDVYVMHNIFKKAKKVTYVDYAYYYYFQRENSIVSSRTYQSYLDLIEGFEKRYKDLEDESDEIDKWNRLFIIRSTVDAFRILAYSERGSEEDFSYLLSIIKKYDPSHELISMLDGLMGVDYAILNRIPKQYFKYRAFMNFLKALDFESKLKKTKRNAVKAAYYSKLFLQPSAIDFNDLKNKRKKILLMGSPEYNNLGDHLIAYGTERFINEQFPGYPYIDITENDIRVHLNRLKKVIYQDDVILLQGGGNFGNVYPDQSKIREKVIKEFPNNRIILLPQTLYYMDDKKGNKSLKKSINLYNNSENVFLFAREKFSYNKMKECFLNKVYLIPDMALYLTTNERSERSGIGLCLRSDREGKTTLAQKQFISNICHNQFSRVEKFDTCLNRFIKKTDRQFEIESFLNTISQYEMIITDRLHGLVFCVITHTPCIAIADANHKIQGIYEWVKKLKWITICYDPYNIEKSFSEIIAYDNTNIDFTEYYGILTDIIQEVVK